MLSVIPSAAAVTKKGLPVQGVYSNGSNTSEHVRERSQCSSDRIRLSYVARVTRSILRHAYDAISNSLDRQHTPWPTYI